jgi:hypothetical protein
VSRRTVQEKVAAVVFHETGRALNGGRCVRRDCNRRAGQWAHHVPEKSWLRRHGLEGRQWDPEIACPACDRCHEAHTNGSRRFTRGELVVAGVWERAMAWARERDAEPPSGRVIRRPVVSRLEHEYPVRVAAEAA